MTISKYIRIFMGCMGEATNTYEHTAACLMCGSLGIHISARKLAILI
jgi:hypothetical protein